MESMKIDHSKSSTQNTHKRGPSTVMDNDKKCKDEVICIGSAIVSSTHCLRGYRCSSVSRDTLALWSTIQAAAARHRAVQTLAVYHMSSRVPCSVQRGSSAQSMSSEQQTASLSSPVSKSSALRDLLLDAKCLGAISSHFHARYRIVDQQRQSVSVRARSWIVWKIANNL